LPFQKSTSTRWKKYFNFPEKVLYLFGKSLSTFQEKYFIFSGKVFYLFFVVCLWSAGAVKLSPPTGQSQTLVGRPAPAIGASLCTATAGSESFGEWCRLGCAFVPLAFHLLVVTNDSQRTPCYRFAQTRGS